MKISTLRLEFAPGARRGPVVGWLLLGSALALLIVALVPFTLDLKARQHDLRALVELEGSFSEGVKARPAAAKPDPAYLAKVKSAQQVAKSLTAPWAGLLDAIESAPQQSVALLGVEPSSAKQSFRLTAEARDANAMLAYLQALQNDRRLVNVALVSHQVQVQAVGHPIRFQLQAGWGSDKP
jgi:Tfp pilus assembly protein PilN